MNVLGIGEVLWDVFPSQEHLGGAALNFCANVQRLGGRATLISGVGNDDRGHRAIEAMRALGLDTRCIQTVLVSPRESLSSNQTKTENPHFTSRARLHLTELKLTHFQSAPHP